MPFEDFSPVQSQIIHAPLNSRLFVSGPAGCGKTTAGVARMLQLIYQGVPASEILVLVPQRTLAAPYFQALAQPNLPPGGTVSIQTLGGLAQRALDLFWPLIARAAGFAHPEAPPTFLTLETAQYYMARVVRPLLMENYFESLAIDRHRLYSQILDNLNKAAAIGLDASTIAERLKAAWIGEAGQHNIYDQAQECANRFRRFCLENNLLDFSLQLETFQRHLWPSFLCRAMLKSSFRHLIFENVEEDVPIVHDIVREWLPDFESALLIYDEDGGYRTFLGADPLIGGALEDLCDDRITMNESFVSPSSVTHFASVIRDSIHRRMPLHPEPDCDEAFELISFPFTPDMTDGVARRIAQLVNEQGVSPGQIAVLAPFLSDSLRFSLLHRLEAAGIPARSHRPSRSLREEPATRCLLTLARLAHPQWNLPVSRYDLRYAFMQVFEGADLVRADLMAQILYHPGRPEEGLGQFDHLQPAAQSRITYTLGERFETLRAWLTAYRSGEPAELDVFFSRLFGEVLSQPGFRFHTNFDSVAVVARLIESVKKFRQAVAPTLDLPVGQEYIRMVDEGVIAAQYLQPAAANDEDAVLLAPAYTFLMDNRPVAVQFWLDIGSLGWWERLYQPLTHPYVLSRQWPGGRPWSDIDEVTANQRSLDRLVTGLARRCSGKIILCTTGTNERGMSERGMLLTALQSVLRTISLAREEGVDDL